MKCLGKNKTIFQRGLLLLWIASRSAGAKEADRRGGDTADNVTDSKGELPGADEAEFAIEGADA